MTEHGDDDSAGGWWVTKQEVNDRARRKGVVNRAGGRSQGVSDDDRSGDDHRVNDDDRGRRVGGRGRDDHRVWVMMPEQGDDHRMWVIG